jgi:ribose 5-phosphate isomerase B
MKIAIASDHAGYEEKERLKPLLAELGIQYEDPGTDSEASVEYPDYARKVYKTFVRLSRTNLNITLPVRLCVAPRT